MSHLRLLAASVILGAVISACGITVFRELPEEDCSLKPVGEWTSWLRFGPQVALALCASAVEVNGHHYSVGVGRWLDEDALELTEYAQVTRSNGPVYEPTAYSIAGVDPNQMLVMKTSPDDRDDIGPVGPYWVLWGDLGNVPADICPYSDPADPQYPAECRLIEQR